MYVCAIINPISILRNQSITIITSFGIFFLLISVAQLVQAQSKTDSLLHILKTGNLNESKQSLLYYQLAKAYYDTDPDSAANFSKKGLVLAQKHQYIEGKAKNTFMLGNVAIKMDSTIKARDLYTEASKLCNKYDDDKIKLSIWIMLGYTYDLLSDYNKSLECYFKGLHFADSLNSTDFIPRFQNNIAIIYAKTDDRRKAITFYLSAATGFKETGDEKYYANTLLNIGGVYLSLKSKDSALLYLNKSKEINERLNNHYGLSNYYSNIGEIEIEAGRYEKALISFQHQLEEIEKLDDSFFGSRSYLKIGVLIQFGMVYSKMEEFNKATDSYKQAFQLANKSSFIRYISEVSLGLSNVYEKSGRLDSALAYYKLFQKYSDSLEKEENIKKIAELEMDYKIQEERKVMQLEKESVESRQKVKGLILFSIIGTTIAALLFFILLFVRQRNKHTESRLKEQNLQLEKENLARELEYKNKELTTNVMYLLKKNEFISDISNKLKGADCKSELKEPKVISGIISELDKNSSHEVWQEFETRFQEIYGDFYKRLNERFPDLTPNDLKLSAFLKLNMTTKEISAITYQSTETLKTARHRLRKKLGLKREDNLVAFLNRV
jgi:tetratricopeptide (TPR) repeat protein